MVREKILKFFLERFAKHHFFVKMDEEKFLVGTGEPEFTLRINGPISLVSLLESTSLALGEAYMDGTIDVEDGSLYSALDALLSQMDNFSTNQHSLRRLLFPSTSKKNQLQAVQSHYDIGNEFYKLWLDESMSYSCGYFKTSGDTLHDAQVNKVNYILEKLHLKEGMSLLDIGCGWGFLLIQAAKKYKVRGTGVTLSEGQYNYFSRQIADLGLEDTLEVRLMDYRDLPSWGRTFDRVVSVGMLEHVGRDNYRKFMDCASSVMNDGGVFLLHFISALKEYSGDPWMKKYIFPGGMIPSLREIISQMAEFNFHTLDVENLRLHYSKTLLCWEKNFMEHSDEIKAQYGERFFRMWHLYLAACAASFHNGVIDLHQILFSKGINNELPIVRWY